MENSVLRRIAKISERVFGQHLEKAKQPMAELPAAERLRVEAALRFANTKTPPSPAEVRCDLRESAVIVPCRSSGDRELRSTLRYDAPRGHLRPGRADSGERASRADLFARSYFTSLSILPSEHESLPPQYRIISATFLQGQELATLPNAAKPLRRSP